MLLIIPPNTLDDDDEEEEEKGDRSRCVTVRRKTECEREEPSFIPVAATALCVCARADGCVEEGKERLEIETEAHAMLPHTALFLSSTTQTSSPTPTPSYRFFCPSSMRASSSASVVT